MCPRRSTVCGGPIAGASGREVALSLLAPIAAVAVAVGAALALGIALPTGSVWSFIALTVLCLAVNAAVLLVARAFGYSALGQLGRRLKSSFGKQR